MKYSAEYTILEGDTPLKNVIFLHQLHPEAKERYEKSIGKRLKLNQIKGVSKMNYWYSIRADKNHIDWFKSNKVLDEYEINEKLKSVTKDLGLRSIVGFEMELVC